LSIGFPIDFLTLVFAKVLSNDRLIGTCIIHLGQYSDMVQGKTTTLKLDLVRNWAVNFKQPTVGSLTVELTAINFSYPPAFEESVSVIAEDAFGVDLATKIARTGLKVYLGLTDPNVKVKPHHSIKLPCPFIFTFFY
jgi:hypothetical protein